MTERLNRQGLFFGFAGLSAIKAAAVIPLVLGISFPLDPQLPVKREPALNQ